MTTQRMTSRAKGWAAVLIIAITVWAAFGAGWACGWADAQ